MLSLSKHGAGLFSTLPRGRFRHRGRSGEGGIRTHGTFWVHTLSRRAVSSTHAPLRTDLRVTHQSRPQLSVDRLVGNWVLSLGQREAKPSALRTLGAVLRTLARGDCDARKQATCEEPQEPTSCALPRHSRHSSSTGRLVAAGRHPRQPGRRGDRISSEQRWRLGYGVDAAA